MNHDHFISAVDETISKGVEKGILHLVQKGKLTTDNTIIINGKERILCLLGRQKRDIFQSFSLIFIFITFFYLKKT